MTCPPSWVSYLVTTQGWETAAGGQLLVSRFTGQVALGLEEPEEETAPLLTRPQTLFMPVARHPVEFIEFVATVIKPNRFHRGDLICKL